MMWGSFGLGICMMMISILLSFQDQGGQLAKSTSAASVAFFFLYMVSEIMRHSRELPYHVLLGWMDATEMY